MKEFAPEPSQDPEFSEADAQRIERYVDLMGVSVDEAKRHFGLDQGDTTPSKPVWQSKNEHPSNYHTRVDYKSRRSNKGPNYGEEEVDPIYFQTGDVELSDEQKRVNDIGAAEARAALRALRTEPDDARQRALDRARDERRWNKS